MTCYVLSGTLNLTQSGSHADVLLTDNTMEGYTHSCVTSGIRVNLVNLYSACFHFMSSLTVLGIVVVNRVGERRSLLKGITQRQVVLF